MGSPLSPASKREEEAIGLVVVVVGNAATGSLSIRAGGSGDKLGIAINSYLTLTYELINEFIGFSYVTFAVCIFSLSLSYTQVSSFGGSYLRHSAHSLCVYVLELQCLY